MVQNYFKAIKNSINYDRIFKKVHFKKAIVVLFDAENALSVEFSKN